MPAEASWSDDAARLDRLVRSAHARLVRESASRELVERRSFSAAVVDGRGRVVVATEFAPIANLEELARVVAERFPDLPGDDVLLTNDPYSGGTRVQDHFAIAPFADPTGGSGYAIASAATADVGGMTLGNEFAAAGDLWTEGVRTTPIRLVRGGEVDADAIRLLEINSRLPLLIVADAKTLASVAAAMAAEAPPLLESGAAEGRIAESRDRVAERARAEGSTERAATIATSTEIRLGVAAGNGSIAFDLDGSAGAQRDNNGNATAPTLTSAVAQAVGAALGCHPNSGLTEAITIAIPAGSCVDAQFPLPVGAGRYQIGDAVHELVLDALAEVLPES